MRTLREFVNRVADVNWLIFGWIKFSVSGKTPERAYQGMIRLFCATGGWSTEILSRAVSLFSTHYAFDTSTGILGNLSNGAAERIAEKIRDQGYYVFEKKLDPAVCDELRRIALETPCSIQPLDAELASESKEPVFALYDPENPIGIRYDIPTQALLDERIVQNLLRDHSILAVAQAYLKAPPVVDIVTMWWNSAFGGEPSKQAAQYFHFDMDRLKWLKFFFYVTDVTEDSGPHCFVSKSQRLKGIPTHLLNKGYTRLTDEEVDLAYPQKEDFKVFSGPRGLILAEDTRGIHKGKNVKVGDRLVFQLEFTNSLFGGKLDESKLRNVVDPILMDMMNKYPRLYSAFGG